MKSETPKVLFDVNDEPLCMAPFRALASCCDKIVVVVGYRGADVKLALSEAAKREMGAARFESQVLFVTQDPPRGTGDAVRRAIEGAGHAVSKSEEIIVLNGDLPLIRGTTIERFAKTCRAERASSACLSFRTSNPKGLGRILRDETGVFTGIREEADASADEKRIREVNGGVYYFSAELLTREISSLQSGNAQGEFYLTDLLGAKPGRRSEAMLVRAPNDLMGVNTTWELAQARRIAQSRLQRALCEEKGVDFRDPASAFVSARAQFHGSCTIGPGVSILGDSVIEAGVVIEGQVLLEKAIVRQNAKILWGCVIRESTVGVRSSVGPLAHLRPGTELEEGVRIGNFVETKKTRFGKNAKAAHLTYLGDAEIGEEANIGCGTITCNYDGFQKHRTKVGARAFVGSDTQLIAPVVIGDDAYIASGTAVTQDIPSGALALARANLVIKPEYAKRLLDKKKKPSGSGK